MSEHNEIPASVRKIVDERDGQFCRVCGEFLGANRGIHHIVFGGDDRGMGGKRVHDPDEMLTVCWGMFGNGCHEALHRDKAKWQEAALLAVQNPGTTVLQVMRWSDMFETSDVR